MRTDNETQAGSPADAQAGSAGRGAFHAGAVGRRVAEALRHRCGVGPGERIMLAVSGGADSVALLRLLASLAPRRGWELSLVVAHVQHHLRPVDQAEADARFVAGLADELELAFVRHDVRADLGPGNVEARARRLRYDALASLAAEHGCPWVATGHHADDQLETMLLRLARGAGPRGLAGMRYRRRLTSGSGSDAAGAVRLIRPLLDIPRQALLAMLTAKGQAWREDQTNADLSRLRNRIRAEVAPALRAAAPAVARHAGRAAEQLAQADHLVQRAALAARRRLDDAGLAMLDAATDDAASLEPAALATWPRRIARRVQGLVLAAAIRGVYRDDQAPMDGLGPGRLDALLRAVRDHVGGRRVFNLGPAGDAVLTRDRLVLHRRPASPSRSLSP